MIRSTQHGSATETRSELACATRIPVPPPAPSVPEPSVPPPGKQVDPEAFLEALEARDKELDARTLDGLMRENDDDLVAAVVRRLHAAKGNLTRTERDLLLLDAYDGEVNNGGHHQFFFNSSGDDALGAHDAMVRLGAPAIVLEIFDCALTAFPHSRPDQNRERRNEQLAAWGDLQFEIFDRLDDAYYRLDAPAPAPSAAYIRVHADELPNASAPLAR